MKKEEKVQQYKKDQVALLKDMVSGYDDYVFVDYRGMSVKEVTTLRASLREFSARFHVVKNNYLKLALSQSKRVFEESQLKGPTAIALMPEGASKAVKAILEFPRENPLEVKGGAISGDLYTLVQLVEYSKLPGKEELLAILLGTLNAPMQSLVGVMQAGILQLLYVLHSMHAQQVEE